MCHSGHFWRMFMFHITLHLTFIFLQAYQRFNACLQALKLLFPKTYNTWQKNLGKGTQNKHLCKIWHWEYYVILLV